MSAQHTPGPWHVGGSGRFIYDESGWGVANATVIHVRREPEESRANASLIAAAPDLLEVIDEAYAELLADSHRDGPRSLLLTRIEAAIAKATGGAA